MKMLDNIVAHSLQVCRVAVFLSDQLRREAIHLNNPLIIAGALLHDITKTRSFNTHENHALTGGQMVTECGFPEVGALVRQHVRLDDGIKGRTPNEAHIVNYADKRVLHDRIVTFEKRMAYIMEKYGKAKENRPRLYKLRDTSLALEGIIFRNLDFAPDDLENRILPRACSAEFQQYRQVCGRPQS